MNTDFITTRVHRFGNHVAVSIHNGDTVYLSPGHARQFAMAILQCELYATTEPFTSHTFKFHELTMEGKA